MTESRHNIVTAMLLLAAGLLAGCSSDSTDDPQPSPTNPDQQIIHLNADVWRVMEGTRATTYDGGAVDGSFKVYAYYNATTDCYINGEVVNYSVSGSSWAGTPQRWPQNSGKLDFFAYMPTDLTNTYCTFDPTAYNESTNADGYSAGTPRIVCTNLPMEYDSSSPTEGQGSGLQEFVYAFTPEQDEDHQGESGVTMKFYHPFARIKFQLSASHPDITINSITFKGLKTGGTCTFSLTTPPATTMYNTSTWTSLTPAGTSDFKVTLKDDAAVFNSNPAASVVPIGGYSGGAHQSVSFLMVPQTFSGDIEVNATWIDWGEPFAHNVSTNIGSQTWAAGTSYTYTFTITETDLRVDTSKFTEQW